MARGCGNCCCCSLKTGLIIGNVVVALFAIALATMIMIVHGDNLIRVIPFFEKYTFFFPSYMVFVSAGALVLLTCLCLLPERGSGFKKVLAVLVVCAFFVSAGAWAYYGTTITNKFRDFAEFILPGTHLFKRALKSGKKSDIHMAAAGSRYLNQFTERIAYQILPAPLNTFYFLGRNSWIPLVIIGVIPTLIILFFAIGSVPFLFVIINNGTGAECQPHGRIEWYYELSDKDRRLLDTGMYECIDDDSSDEEEKLAESDILINTL